MTLMAEKLHWTQRPGAKAKKAAQQQKAWATRRRNQKAPVSPETDHEFERNVAYLVGKIETIIEVYADRLGVPRAALTSRVADLLRASARR